MTSLMWLVTCHTIEFDKNVCQTKLRYIIKIFCRSRGEVVNNGVVSAKSWPLVFSPLNCFCLIWFQFFADFIFVTIVDTYWSHIIPIVVKQSRVRYLFNQYLTFLHNIFIIPACRYFFSLLTQFPDICIFQSLNWAKTCPGCMFLRQVMSWPPGPSTTRTQVASLN